MIRNQCPQGKAQATAAVRNAYRAMALLLPAACQSSVQVALRPWPG
jgi:hypothetical protein